MIEFDIGNVKAMIFKEKKTLRELSTLLISLGNLEDKNDKAMIENQIDRLKKSFSKINNELVEVLGGLDSKRPLVEKEEIPVVIPEKVQVTKPGKFDYKMSELDREILKRLKKVKEKKEKKKVKRPGGYSALATKLFAAKVKDFTKQKRFVTLEKDLRRSNLNYTPTSYFSIIVLSVIISVIASFIIFIFLLVFDLSQFPLLSIASGNFFGRLASTFWVLLVIPALTFLFMYTYPSLERKSLEGKINQELPFATIHMSAISGSLVEPTKIFSIVASTGEYPNMEKEFNKLLNEINVYGYDLVTALKDTALNCASQKLSELFNGLATTITSGGELYDFFEKRSQTLLFEYRLDKEKNTKSAETFMDIYISVVIAAPMILMLLLMMIKISGIGISLTTSMITLMVVAGVSLINVAFLAFLQIKQPKGA